MGDLSTRYIILIGFQIPVCLGLLYATGYCLRFRRNNPRGTALLGIAVLLSFAALVPPFVLDMYLRRVPSDPGLRQQWELAYFGLRILGPLLQGLSWVFVARAVYAAAPHGDVRNIDDDLMMK